MARILNNTLCTVMVFLLTFAWSLYCLKNTTLAVVLASVVALSACYIIFVVLEKWETKQKTKRNKKNLLRDFAIYLQFNCDNSVLFTQTFRYYNFMTKILDFDSIIATKEYRNFVAFCFAEDVVNAQKIRNLVVAAKRNNCQRLLVFGQSFAPEILSLANSQIPTKFVDIANVYSLMQQSETLPQFPQTNVKKQRLLPQIAFSKKRFGWYFFGAVFMLVSSAFSMLKLYSLVWSTVLFGLAAYSRFNHRFNPKPTSFQLE